MKGLPISVVIPAYQDVEGLNRCINSILDSDFDDYEIVVVDDGSKPPLSGRLVENVKIRYVYQERKGAAAARNLGVETSRYELIYFIDSDVEVCRHNLRRLAEHFREPSVGAVSGINDFSPLNDVYMANYQAFFEYFLHYHPEVEFVDTFNPRNAAIRKDTFLSLNGFDASFGSTLEEAEFAQRLAQRGIKVKNDAEMIVRHTYPSSLRKAVINHFRRGFTWLRIYLRKGSKTTNVGGTSPRVIKGIVMHLLFFLALFFSFFSLKFIWAALFFYLLHLRYFAPFYRYCFEKRGLFFGGRVIFTKLLMSFVMGLSQFFSLITFPFYKRSVL